MGDCFGPHVVDHCIAHPIESVSRYDGLTTAIQAILTASRADYALRGRHLPDQLGADRVEVALLTRPGVLKCTTGSSVTTSALQSPATRPPSAA